MEHNQLQLSSYFVAQIISQKITAWKLKLKSVITV